MARTLPRMAIVHQYRQYLAQVSQPSEDVFLESPSMVRDRCWGKRVPASCPVCRHLWRKLFSRRSCSVWPYVQQLIRPWCLILRSRRWCWPQLHWGWALFGLSSWNEVMTLAALRESRTSPGNQRFLSSLLDQKHCTTVSYFFIHLSYGKRDEKIFPL